MTSSNDIIILDDDDDSEQQKQPIFQINNGTETMKNSNNERKRVNKTIVNKKRELLANIHSNRFDRIDDKKINSFNDNKTKNTNSNNNSGSNKTTIPTTATTTTTTTSSYKNIICLDDDDHDDASINLNANKISSNSTKEIIQTKQTTPTKVQSPLCLNSNRNKSPNAKSNFLADIHEKRLNIGDGGIAIDENYHNVSNGDKDSYQPNKNNNINNSSNNSSNKIKTNEPFNFQQSLDLRKQLNSIRSEQHKSYRNDKLNKKKFFDLNDIDTLQKQELQNRMISASMETTIPTVNRNTIHTIDNTLLHPEAIGRKALEFSNKFRSTQGKPLLIWNQAIYHIGVEHSKNMAEKKVAFGHDGFNDRAKRYPFSPRGAGENVAYTNDPDDIANKVVNGWINSPGHRKNLLANFNVCSIGVYKNSEGFWYLTQLFGLQ
ncbi:hypothetical protein ACTFIZ_004379 [Dictyostelium cf. discoideum]